MAASRRSPSTKTPTSHPARSRSASACPSATWIPPDGSSVGRTNATRMQRRPYRRTGTLRPATIVRAMPDEATDAAAADLLRERDRLRAVAAPLPALQRDVQRLRGGLAAVEGWPAWRLTAPLRGSRALVRNRRDLVFAAGRR